MNERLRKYENEVLGNTVIIPINLVGAKLSISNMILSVIVTMNKTYPAILFSSKDNEKSPT